MTPGVRAIEDFIAQTEHDLGFVQGDIIQLVKFADENWGVGKLQGRQGIFPICFTEPWLDPAPAPPLRGASIPENSKTLENEKENKFSKLSNWKRSKSPETEPKVKGRAKKLSTIWKEPDIKRLSTDLGSGINSTKLFF